MADATLGSEGRRGEQKERKKERERELDSGVRVQS